MAPAEGRPLSPGSFPHVRQRLLETCEDRLRGAGWAGRAEGTESRSTGQASGLCKPGQMAVARESVCFPQPPRCSVGPNRGSPLVFLEGCVRSLCSAEMTGNLSPTAGFKRVVMQVTQPLWPRGRSALSWGRDKAWG